MRRQPVGVALRSERWWRVCQSVWLRVFLCFWLIFDYVMAAKKRVATLATFKGYVRSSCV